MAKKLKIKTYKKDVDDHYVVVINPWANSPRNPRTQVEMNYIGAWLRIAFKKPDEKGIVRAIFSRSKRDEVIVQLNPCVDVEIGLGAHLWSSFIKRDELDRIEREDKGLFFVMAQYPISHVVSMCYLTPKKDQWKENSPSQDAIPDFIAVKRQYPDPVLSHMPSIDARLQSLLLPMPRLTLAPAPEPALIPVSNPPVPIQPPKYLPLDKTPGESVLRQNRIEQQGSSAPEFTSYQPPVHFPRVSESTPNKAGHANVKTEDGMNISKLDKYDPYEEDEAALNTLNNSTVKREEITNRDIRNEFADVKSEPEDRKPDISNAPYEPSSSLVKALSELNGGFTDVEEEKPVVKAEDYQPSQVLIDALSQYTSHSKASEGMSDMALVPDICNDAYAADLPTRRNSLKRDLQGPSGTYTSREREN
ncbi:hypothetical protein EW145_g4479 [Phellinidium pouzarii]|uniref:Uncharacterized protein n=1 Tax=Phellinidium pouzarii TaxID=167371 RepID=A0A4S4L3H8_9AGAM|nr:hypothetical protein EW145_g4479 [Phellinidium pouzarii]